MLVLLTWVAAIGMAAIAIDLAQGGRRIRDLSLVAPLDDGPLVSIVVAARNEEQGIEAGVRSLLRLAYQSVEVIVVNDRSSDGTGAILERVQGEHPRLSVVTVSALPAGWLGKNHALALGAARAKGELLLFTDADVVFEPSVLGRAMRVLQDDGVDHLTAVPGVQVRGVGLRMLVTTFGVLFTMYSRPWKARDPRSRRHIGIGAFNLVRSSAYARIGTHAAIAVRPDDDMKLAREVKRAGLSQEVVEATHLLSVEWYSSVRDMINGLMKNAFAGVNYNVWLLCLSTATLLFFTLWPWAALAMTSGWPWTASLVAVLLQLAIAARQAVGNGMSPAYALLYPVGVVGFIYIMWRSAFLALSRGAITWRETSYPLKTLKQAVPAQPLPSSRRV